MLSFGSVSSFRLSRQRLAGGVLVLGALEVFAAGSGRAEEKPAWPTVEHVDPATGRFTFRAPRGWLVAQVPGRKRVTQVLGSGTVVRFVHFRSEIGPDSLQASCASERLTGPMGFEPMGTTHYAYAPATVGGHAALDSAVEVTYDAKIEGHRRWRQRTVSVVGVGESLCIIVHCPARVWKKSKTIRQQLDAIVASVAFNEQP
jgi:hypothetical protein